jgi:hypothetical protein
MINGSEVLLFWIAHVNPHSIQSRRLSGSGNICRGPNPPSSSCAAKILKTAMGLNNPAWPSEPDPSQMKSDSGKAADAALHTAVAEDCNIQSLQACPRRVHQSGPI